MRTLDDAAHFWSGGTPTKKNSEYWNGNIPWYSASNMDERFLGSTDVTISEDGLKAGSRLAPKGSTLLLVRGSGLFNYVPVCFAERPVAFNQDVKAIVPKDGYDPVFLHFWIESLRETLNENIGVTGIGAGKFELAFLKSLPFPDFDEDTQKQLGKIASRFDRKIENCKKQNAVLEEISRSLFRAWFVDFEPVRAKAAGATSFRGMPQELFEALPDSFEDSEIGEIPAGWEVEPIGELAKCVGGGTPSTKNEAYWSGGQHPFCTPKDMSNLKSMVLFDTSRHVTDAGLSKISSGALPVGTVLMSSRAPIGYIAVNWCEVSINQGIVALIPTKLPTEYLRYWLEFNMPTIEANAGGTTFAEISKSKFRQIDALQPPEGHTIGFSAITRPIFEKIACNAKTISVLENLRDALLPKLISGEIEAPDLEALEDGG